MQIEELQNKVDELNTLTNELRSLTKIKDTTSIKKYKVDVENNITNKQLSNLLTPSPNDLRS